MIRKDIVFISLIGVILSLMIVPLPGGMIDVLIAINLTLALVLLMVAVYMKHPSDFSTFPTVILIATAFRLALSIGTTRLILSEAEGGQIIDTFGSFVLSGSIVIGLVIFMIITVVQFLVITKGAERVAEVGARFALDAMPGKQMSIDADVRAGNIETDEANELRARLNKDSQFFGSMDGAMKFIKGDAVAGLIITAINLVGGIMVGVSVHALSVGEAISIYSLLTIGDGLVAQIPALIMSLVAGVIVTRATNDENVDLGSDIVRELAKDPRVPGMASVAVLLIGLIPGFPTLTFIIASIMLFTWAYFLSADMKRMESKEQDRLAQEAEEKVEGPTNLSLRFSWRIGTQLEELVDLEQIQSQLNEMFEGLRMARGVTFALPEQNTSKPTQLRGIAIDLDEVAIETKIFPADKILLEGGPELAQLINVGEDQIQSAEWPDRSFSWAPRSHLSTAKALKIRVLDLNEAIAVLIFRLYEQNLGTLFGKDQFEAILEQAVAIDADAMAEIEGKVTRPVMYQVFRLLVEDGVPLRPLPILIDSFLDWSRQNDDSSPMLFSECLRGSLRRQLCDMITGDENILAVAMIDPKLEALARENLATAKRAGTLSSFDGLLFEADETNEVIGSFQRLQNAQRRSEGQIAVVVSPDLRRRFRNFLSANRIHLPVISSHEISPDVVAYPVEFLTLESQSEGEVDLDERSIAAE